MLLFVNTTFITENITDADEIYQLVKYYTKHIAWSGTYACSHGQMFKMERSLSYLNPDPARKDSLT